MIDLHAISIQKAIACTVNKFSFFDLVILAEYLISVVILVSSDSSIGPSPRTRISFLILSGWLDELLSAPKITTFLPHSLIGNGNCERASIPIP